MVEPAALWKEGPSTHSPRSRKQPLLPKFPFSESPQSHSRCTSKFYPYSYPYFPKTAKTFLKLKLWLLIYDAGGRDRTLRNCLTRHNFKLEVDPVARHGYQVLILCKHLLQAGERWFSFSLSFSHLFCIAPAGQLSSSQHGNNDLLLALWVGTRPEICPLFPHLLVFHLK